MKLDDLPLLNASLNGLSAGFILLGWFFINRGEQKKHIACMICALVTSSLFLCSYLTYHFGKAGIVTRFTAEGWIRPVYFVLLISHVLLAFATVPMVLATVIPALGKRFDRHKRVARWTLPVWLYVSVTGVLVYLMLYQWFPSTGR